MCIAVCHMKSAPTSLCSHAHESRERTESSAIASERSLAAECHMSRMAPSWKIQ